MPRRWARFWPARNVAAWCRSRHPKAGNRLQQRPDNPPRSYLAPARRLPAPHRRHNRSGRRANQRTGTSNPTLETPRPNRATRRSTGLVHHRTRSATKSATCRSVRPCRALRPPRPRLRARLLCRNKRRRRRKKMKRRPRPRGDLKIAPDQSRWGRSRRAIRLRRVPHHKTFRKRTLEANRPDRPPGQRPMGNSRSKRAALGPVVAKATALAQRAGIRETIPYCRRPGSDRQKQRPTAPRRPHRHGPWKFGRARRLRYSRHEEAARCRPDRASKTRCRAARRCDQQRVRMM